MPIEPSSAEFTIFLFPHPPKAGQCQQARIAEESLAQAQQQEQEGHDTEAIRLYARTLVELEASGKRPVELNDVRHKRAQLLRKVGDASAALLEFERFARAYEADAFIAGYQYVDRDAVELAAWDTIVWGRSSFMILTISM